MGFTFEEVVNWENEQREITAQTLYNMYSHQTLEKYRCWCENIANTKTHEDDINEAVWYNRVIVYSVLKLKANNVINLLIHNTSLEKNVLGVMYE